MGNDNTKSTTWSIRVPLWMSEELDKKKTSPEESRSALAIRAFEYFIVGGDDAVEG